MMKRTKSMSNKTNKYLKANPWMKFQTITFSAM